MTSAQHGHHRKQPLYAPSSGIAKKAPRSNARAWRHEEEEYLLRARSRSTPYKQIAAHLHKTELACRLHYHQMTFGAHRRQSNLSMHGAGSEWSRSPQSVREGSHSRHVTSSITISPSPLSYTTFATSPASKSVKSNASPAMSMGGEWYSPPTYQRLSSRANAPNHGIGLTWPHASPPMLAPPDASQGTADLGRLLYDYADSSRAFFSTLANQFSQTPAELEAAFRAALGQQSNSLSPQPDRNQLPPLEWPYNGSDASQRRAYSEPQSPLNRDLHAPSPKRCTVSSLLNFETATSSHEWGVSGA